MPDYRLVATSGPDHALRSRSRCASRARRGERHGVVETRGRDRRRGGAAGALSDAPTGDIGSRNDASAAAAKRPPSRNGEARSRAEITRCGYVALIGAPNAGKSTLLNQLVGRKLAIVTPKVQTTRTRLLGIAIEGEAQLIFVDTPGIFAPRRRLDRAMVAAAWAGAADADRVVLLVDAARPDEPDTRRIIDRLKASGRRAVLALNKIDLVRRDKLLGIAERLFRAGVFRRRCS